MRRILWSVTAVLAATAWACGQAGPAGPTAAEFSCPVDGTHFRVPLVDQGDRAGGMDSDDCWHSLGTQAMPFLVVVCPRCNYAAPREEFPRDVPEAKKSDLLRVLAKSKYRGVADTLAEIPTWERFRLAARCAAVLDRADDRITAVKFASWSVRVEACRSATAAYSSMLKPVTPLSRQINEYFSTRGMADVLREITGKIAAAAKPEEKNHLNLHLAMMVERAGFAVKRDALLAKLGEAYPADATLSEPLNRFLKLLALERSFQTELVDLLRERVQKEENRVGRSLTHYLLADTLRRLGRDAEAVAEFRSARKLMPQPSEMRTYTDYFLTMLAPGEPLPAPEPPSPGPGPGEKAPETTPPAVTPQKPAPAPEAPKTESR